MVSMILVVCSSQVWAQEQPDLLQSLDRCIGGLNAINEMVTNYPDKYDVDLVEYDIEAYKGLVRISTDTASKKGSPIHSIFASKEASKIEDAEECAQYLPGILKFDYFMKYLTSDNPKKIYEDVTSCYAGVISMPLIAEINGDISIEQGHTLGGSIGYKFTAVAMATSILNFRQLYSQPELLDLVSVKDTKTRDMNKKLLIVTINQRIVARMHSTILNSRSNSDVEVLVEQMLAKCRDIGMEPFAKSIEGRIRQYTNENKKQ